MANSIFQDRNGAPPEHVGYLLRWEWSDPVPQGDKSLHKAFLELLWWGYCGGLKPATVAFRVAMLPGEEWSMDDGSVVMLSFFGEPWLRRMPDGTVACFNFEMWEEVYGKNRTADFNEPGYAWVRTKNERLYYDKTSNDEVAMQEAAEDALRAWGMPVPDFEDFLAQVRAIEEAKS